jgi:predicted nucleotidyltransferase
MRTAIDVPIEAIQELCTRHGVAELRIFGSILRDDFGPESDVDFLVSFKDGERLGPWMKRCFDLQEELSRVMGRRVDLVLRGELEASDNYIRRGHVLATAESIYVAG